ncbi:hypothetical protein NW757_14871 [Fusarium falciforme]|nr:hypothetical protein NW757_14871 [Fusarium falciforme]
MEASPRILIRSGPRSNGESFSPPSCLGSFWGCTETSGAERCWRISSSPQQAPSHSRDGTCVFQGPTSTAGWQPSI